MRNALAKVLSLGWYDGTTSGLAQYSQCSATFRYDIVDWDADQEQRAFVFSRISQEIFDHIVEVLSTKEEPRWPFWHPRWQCSPEEKAQYNDVVDKLLAQSKIPEYIVLTDRSFETIVAAKLLDGVALGRLPMAFDGLPVSNSFGYWKTYLGL